MERNEAQSVQSNNRSNQGEGLLLWEKKAMLPRARSAAPSDPGRPRWVARQIHCTQQSQESEHDVMHQCKKLHDALEKERSRLALRPRASTPHPL
jgi:Tfp pilus assembly protein PilV